MPDETKLKKADDTGGIDEQAKDPKPDSRRKLIKAGLLAAPVLLTLKGKPARANGPVSAGSARSA
jgi:hypothetical protein